MSGGKYCEIIKIFFFDNKHNSCHIYIKCKYYNLIGLQIMPKFDFGYAISNFEKVSQTLAI